MNFVKWSRPQLWVATAAMLLAPGSADAFWASHGSYGSYGSRGSYGSYGSVGSHGSYASTGSHGSYSSYGSAGSHGSYSSYGSHGPGPLQRLAARIRARRASHGSYASSGSHGSTGSHGSYGSTGSHGSHGSTVIYHHSASAGSHGSTGGAVLHGSVGSHGSVGGWSATSSASSHVIVSSTPTPATRVIASKPTTTGSGMISVQVPADAQVFVNDKPTTSTGSQRQYVSHGLQPGKSYTYRVRVEFEVDGKLVSEAKSVELTAGGDEALVFAAPTAAPVVAEEQPADLPTTTKLTLRVPTDARVTLAGAETQQTGGEREYVTTRLQAGATWEDYTVRVETEVEGQPVVQERVITLRGGESQTMVFRFEATKLAAK